MFSITEADVNANASPNVTDMASTWAGWAVTAVTSKFYKSQSNQVTEQAPSLSVSYQGSSAAKLQSTAVESIDRADLRGRSDAESNEDSVQWGDMNVRERNYFFCLQATSFITTHFFRSFRCQAVSQITKKEMVMGGKFKRNGRQ